MTNEEKAKEIAWNDSLYNDNQSCAEQCFIAALQMAEWKDENPIITAILFRQCISMLNDVCYEQGTGVDETDIEYVIKVKKLP